MEAGVVEETEEGSGRWVRRATPAPDTVKTLAPGHGGGKRRVADVFSWCRGMPGEGGPRCGPPPVQAWAVMPLSIIWVSWPLPTAPIWVAWIWPSLNSSSIGIERTWYFIALARFSSTFNLTTFSLPS